MEDRSRQWAEAGLGIALSDWTRRASERALGLADSWLARAALAGCACVQGHGDELCLADANFPAQSIAEASSSSSSAGPRIVTQLAADNVQMLKAILKLFPLDQYVDQPVRSETRGGASADTGASQPSDALDEVVLTPLLAVCSRTLNDDADCSDASRSCGRGQRLPCRHLR